MPSDPSIQVTNAARNRGALSRDERARALESFRANGFVILEGLIPAARARELRHAYLRLLREKIARSGLRPRLGRDPRHRKNQKVKVDFRPEGGNHDLNRWNMHLPSERPLFSNEVIANPLVLSITEGLLGRDSVLAMAASDTPLPGSGFQNIHQDDSRLRITVNIPLVDLREDNGPLEVWPGSHLLPGAGPESYSDQPVPHSPADLRTLIQKIRPQRPLLKAGSALIRDHRLVHRGTPNRSRSPRPMLSLYYLPAPETVTPRATANVLARAARAWRETVRGRYDAKVLDAGNRFGQFNEYAACSDRDDHRAIPAGVWDALTPAAKRLLRFASLEDALPSAEAITEPISLFVRLIATAAIPATSRRRRSR